MHYPVVHQAAFDSWAASKDFTESADEGLMPHQHVAKNFLAATPYRGLLLYHGMGTGKTLSAAAAVASVADRRRVTVILPKYLERNFVEALDRRAGDADSRRVTSRDVDIWYLDGLRGEAAQAALLHPGRLDDRLVVVDECHHLFSGVAAKADLPCRLYRAMMRAKNAQFLLLTGTPIVNRVFELALAVNLLSETRDVYDMRPDLSESEAVEIIEDSDAVLAWKWPAGGPLRVTLAPPRWTCVTADDGSTHLAPSDRPRDADNAERVRRLAGALGAGRPRKRACEYDFPCDEAEFDRLYIDGSDIARPLDFQARLRGKISFFGGESGARLEALRVTKVPMSPHQETRYALMEKLERRLRGDRADDGASRTLTRLACNFAYPIQRLFKGQARDYEAHQRALRESVARPVLRERLRDLSTKYAAVLDSVEREDTQFAVYSQFRQNEGLECFARCMEARLGFQRLRMRGADMYATQYGLTGLPTEVPPDPRARKYIVYEGTPESAALVDAFNSGGDIDGVLFTRKGSEGLNLMGVRHVYILESYWHQSRMDQVVARALRMGSHDHLPEEERYVQPHLFLTTHADRDAETSDEAVYRISQQKHELANRALELARGASIDCRTGCFKLSDSVVPAAVVADVVAETTSRLVSRVTVSGVQYRADAAQAAILGSAHAAPLALYDDTGYVGTLLKAGGRYVVREESK